MIRVFFLAILLAGGTALAGDCERTLVASADYAVPSQQAFQSEIAAYDVNADTRLDLVISDSVQPVLFVLSRTSDGFSSAAPIPLGHTASALFVADLDGDARNEIVAAGRDKISTLFANGDGTFRVVSSSSPLNIRAFSGGDFTGDGRFDLVTALVSSTGSTSSLTTFAGAADGTFAMVGTPLELTVGVRDLDAGEVTGDAALDIVIVDLEKSFVLAGTGNGSFTAAKTLTTTRSESAPLIGDFDGDDRDDILIAQSAFASAATRRIFLSTRAYEPVAHNIDNGLSTRGWMAHDLDADGFDDMIDGNLRIWRGNGDGTFTAGWEGVTGGDSTALADFNGDGLLDLAVRTVKSVSFRYRTGALTFDGALSYRTLTGQFVVGDFNGDQRTDVLPPLGMVMHLGDASGVMKTLPRDAAILGQLYAAIGDFNGDGRADLFTPLGFYPGIGDGKFDPKALIAPPPSFDSMRDPQTGDFNGDGKLDIVAREPSGSREAILLTGDSTGRFTFQRVPAIHRLFALEAGDFNGDGISDVVTAGGDFSPFADLRLMTGSPSGLASAGLIAADGVSIFSGNGSLAAGDVDGDGRLDFVATAANGEAILFFRGNGNGTFSAPEPIRIQGPGEFLSSGFGVALGDFTGDGRLDLAVPSDGDYDTSILAQQPDGSFLLVASVLGGEREAAFGDVNGDGLLDLIVLYGSGFDVYLAKCRDAVTTTPPIVRLTGPLHATSKSSVASFIADLSEPDAGGTVTFYEGQTVLGIARVLGTVPVLGGRATLATRSLATGTHRITAVYSGDGRFLRARSGVVEHSVGDPATGGKRRSARH